MRFFVLREGYLKEWGFLDTAYFFCECVSDSCRKVLSDPEMFLKTIFIFGDFLIQNTDSFIYYVFFVCVISLSDLHI